MKTDYSMYEKPEYFWNRELSWLRFNERVMAEGQDSSIPLFERLKFIGITSSNLDEFFMVRVASLKDQEHSRYTGVDIAGMTPREQLAAISEAAHALVASQYKTCEEDLVPALKNEGLHIYTSRDELSKAQAEWVDRWFDEYLYPVLTPMAMDSSRPFPLVQNRSLNIGALIRRKAAKDVKEKRKKMFATVQVPSGLPRYMEIPRGEDGSKAVILLETVVERNMSKLFLGYDIVCACPYRIMRNAELGIDEEDAADLLQEISKKLKKRQRGEVIRLEFVFAIFNCLESPLGIP